MRGGRRASDFFNEEKKEAENLSDVLNWKKFSNFFLSGFFG